MKATQARAKHNYREISNPYELCMVLREEISLSKMKYTDIANNAGVSPQTVGRLASGDTKDPRTNTAIRILFALGRPLRV